MNKTTEALKMAIDLLNEFELQYAKDDLLLPIGYYEKLNACKEALQTHKNYEIDYAKAMENVEALENQEQSKHTSLDDFIAEMEKDPEFKRLMKQERAKLLALFESESREQEPVSQGFKVTAKLGEHCSFKSTTVRKGDMVYTHPAQKPTASLEPLSDDEIEKIINFELFDSVNDDISDFQAFKNLARAIEQAHGIGVKE